MNSSAPPPPAPSVVPTAHGASIAQAAARVASVHVRPWNSLVHALVAFLLLPNLLFGGSARMLGVQRQLVNLDYLLIGVLAPVLGARLTVAAVALALLADAFVSFAPMFNFEIPDALNALRDVWGIDDRWTVVGVIIAVVMTIAACSTLITWIAPRSAAVRSSSYLLAGLLITVGALDVLNGSNRYLQLSQASMPVNFATSGSAKLGEGFAVLVRDGVRGSPPVAVASASAGLFDAEALRGQNVVLVLVESLGLLAVEAGDSALLAPLLGDDITSRYVVRVGSVRSHGSTTNGEMRELCGVDASHRTVKLVNHSACLPNLLARAGYRTTAIHGYKRTFFGRSVWYPQLGFHRAIFDDELRENGKEPSCGFVYRGTCDAKAARAVAAVLKDTATGAPRFVYWLSLNAHIPLDDRSAEAGSFDCATDAIAASSVDVCRWARIESIVIDRVAALAADTTIAATRFVIVGDHPPPFAGKTRGMYVPERVPFVELIPRPAARRPGMGS